MSEKLLPNRDHAHKPATGLYNLVDLGTLGGNDSFGYGINAYGQVVGYSDMPGDKMEHAFRTAPGGDIRDSNALLETPWRTENYAQAINDAGQVVGLTWIPPPSGWKDADGHVITPRPDAFDNNAIHAFRTTATGKICEDGADLGTLGGSFSGAHDINASGQVTGDSALKQGSSRAFRTTATGTLADGTAADLETLGGESSIGHGINVHGQVAGASSLADKKCRHAFRSSGNESPMPILTDLGTLGGTHSTAYDINESGQVVGESALSGDTATHGFRTTAHGSLDDGTATDLGTLGGLNSHAFAINAHGHVVGSSDLAHSEFPGLSDWYAFLYTDEHGMQDLNHLLSPEDCARCQLQSATDINDFGQITGLAIFEDGIRAYLMTPISTAI